MARFQAGCEGNRQEVTRLGDSRSGARAHAAGWQGRITVRTWDEEECDHYRVTLGPHMYSGGSEWTLAAGRLDACRNPAPDVAVALVQLAAEWVQECENLYVSAVEGLENSRERLEDAWDMVAARATDVATGRKDVYGRYESAVRGVKTAERAVKLAQKAARRASRETDAARISYGHAKNAAAKLADAHTGAAAVRAGIESVYQAWGDAGAELAKARPPESGPVGGASESTGAQAAA